MQYNGLVFIGWVSASVKDPHPRVTAAKLRPGIKRNSIKIKATSDLRNHRLALVIVQLPGKSKLESTFLCSQFWSSCVWLSVMEEVRTSVLLINLPFLRKQQECQASAPNLTRHSEPVKSLGVHHLCA